MGKPERRRPLGRNRRTWEENSRMDLKESGWESVDLIDFQYNESNVMHFSFS
jgi:hypothetical protein